MNEHFGDRPQFPPWRQGAGTTLDEWTGKRQPRGPRHGSFLPSRDHALLTAMTYLQAKNNITVVSLAQLLRCLEEAGQ